MNFSKFFAGFFLGSFFETSLVNYLVEFRLRQVKNNKDILSVIATEPVLKGSLKTFHIQYMVCLFFNIPMFFTASFNKEESSTTKKLVNSIIGASIGGVLLSAPDVWRTQGVTGSKPVQWRDVIAHNMLRRSVTVLVLTLAMSDLFKK